jgi:hypothetical protein
MKVVPFARVIVDPSVPLVASAGSVPLLPEPCPPEAFPPSAELASLDEDVVLFESLFLSTMMAATAAATITACNKGKKAKR